MKCVHLLFFLHYPSIGSLTWRAPLEQWELDGDTFVLTIKPNCCTIVTHALVPFDFMWMSLSVRKSFSSFSQPCVRAASLANFSHRHNHLMKTILPFCVCSSCDEIRVNRDRSGSIRNTRFCCFCPVVSKREFHGLPPQIFFLLAFVFVSAFSCFHAQSCTCATGFQSILLYTEVAEDPPVNDVVQHVGPIEVGRVSLSCPQGRPIKSE